MTEQKKERGLGFGADLLGLDELLTTPVTTEAVDPINRDIDGAIRYVPYHKLKPGSAQPRKTMNDESLVELGRSIRQHGIIQPIVVQANARADGYRIVAGERRWRAAKLANLQQVPVIVRDFTERQAVAVALIENIQREDLNVVDQAKGLQRLVDDYELTHQEVASLVGKSRAAVSNMLRLLTLEESLLAHLVAGRLDMGHARCLLSLPALKRTTVADQVIAQQLSVRATERLIQKVLAAASLSEARQQKPQAQRQQQWHDWAAELHQKLAMPVRIRQGRGKKVNLELCCDDDQKLQQVMAALEQLAAD